MEIRDATFRLPLRIHGAALDVSIKDVEFDGSAGDQPIRYGPAEPDDVETVRRTPWSGGPPTWPEPVSETEPRMGEGSDGFTPEEREQYEHLTDAKWQPFPRHLGLNDSYAPPVNHTPSREWERERRRHRFVQDPMTHPHCSQCRQLAVAASPTCPGPEGS